MFEKQADGTWVESAKLGASDGFTTQQFGAAVSLSGGMATIGAAFDDDNGPNSGAAYLFVRDRFGTWVETTKLLPTDGDDGDVFGLSVAMEGELAVIGAYADEDNGWNSGSAYVFEIDAPQPGCDPVIDPPALDFGAIEVGETVALATTRARLSW